MTFPADTTPIAGAPAGTSTLGGSTPTHTDHHDALAAGINAVVTELGANPSGSEADVAARFAALDATVAGLPGGDPTVFHVDSYGAVGDGVTDDTTAIRDAIAAAVAAGGGIVQLGAKTYLANGPLVTTGGGYAVIPLPTGVPIHIRGVQPANHCDPRTSTGYSIIKTTKTGLTRSGTYGVPSLIGGPTDSSWAETTASIEDVCLWLPANPTISGVDLWHVRRCVVDGLSVVAINVGDSDYTQPTSLYTFGLRTPEAQNYNAVIIRNAQAHGTYAGLVGSVESLTVGYWVSKWCVVGWGPTPGGHGAAVLKMSLEWCKYAISGWTETGGAGAIVDGPAGTTVCQVSATELAIEDATAGHWYSTTAHVNDSTNRLKGVVYFDRYDGTGAGVVSTLTKTGGANLTTVALASPSFGTSSSSLSVQDENGTAITGVTQLDFQGAGVTATAGTGEVVVTIPGGGGGSTQYTKRDRLTAVAGNDTLTLGDTPINDSVHVWVNNVIKWPGVDYTRSGAVITFGAPLTAGQVVLVSYGTTNASAPAATLTSGTTIPTYPDAVMALSPLAYWKQDDSSTAVTDSSGNGRTMSPLGTLTYSQHTLLAKGTGTSILYGGAGNATLPSAAWMETDYVSVVMRYEPRSADLTGNKALITRWTGGGPTDYAWLLWISGGKVQAHVKPDGGASISAIGTTTLVAGTAYTLGMAFNGTTLKVYLNGTEEGSVAAAGVLQKGSGAPIEIARISGTTYGGGYIDEVALFGVALSGGDMANLHTAAITA